MTDIDYAGLREKAEKATPGPWEAGEQQLWGDDDIPQVAVLAGGSPITWDDHAGDVFYPADAEFIAAADPQTVLAMLDKIEELQAELDTPVDEWDGAPSPPTWYAPRGGGSR